MKSFLLPLALLFLSIPSICATSNITIHGKINGAIENMVHIILNNDNPLQGKVIYRARLNENNEFLIDLQIQNAQFIELNVDDKSFEVFASSNINRIEFETEATAPEQTLKFKGEKVFTNSFYNSFKRSYQWNLGKKESYAMGGLTTLVDENIKNKALSYSKEDFFRMLKMDHENQIRYLHNTPSLDGDFFRLLENEINWKYETNKIAYFLFNKERFTPFDLQRFWVRFGLLQNADINDDRVIGQSSFQNLLSAFIHFLHLQTPVKENIEASYFTFIRKNLMNQSRYFMLAKLMINNYQLGNSKLAMQEFKSFKRENPYPTYSQTLENVFGNEGQYLSAQVAPNFKALDLADNDVWLNNYSGRVVYVSFWASWCAPCIKNFRETSDLRRRLKDSGVVFLNVNLDKNEEIWRNFLARENIVGENVYGVDVKEVKEVLKITALPHYFLVNKSGQIEYLSSQKLNECYNDFMKLLVE